MQLGSAGTQQMQVAHALGVAEGDVAAQAAGKKEPGAGTKVGQQGFKWIGMIALHIGRSACKGGLLVNDQDAGDFTLCSVIQPQPQPQALKEINMIYITTLASTDADTTTAATLVAVKAKIGLVPNLYATLAKAPAALNSLLQQTTRSALASSAARSVRSSPWRPRRPTAANIASAPTPCWARWPA